MSLRNIKAKIPKLKPTCEKDLQVVIERLRRLMQSSGAKTTTLSKKVTKTLKKSI